MCRIVVSRFSRAALPRRSPAPMSTVSSRRRCASHGLDVPPKRSTLIYRVPTLLYQVPTSYLPYLEYSTHHSTLPTHSTRPLYASLLRIARGHPVESPNISNVRARPSPTLLYSRLGNGSSIDSTVIGHLPKYSRVHQRVTTFAGGWSGVRPLTCSRARLGYPHQSRANPEQSPHGTMLPKAAAAVKPRPSTSCAYVRAHYRDNQYG